MYTIYDDIHSEYVADFATFDDAIDAIRSYSSQPWDVPPNRAPCKSWKKCGRRLHILEFPDKEVISTYDLKVCEIRSTGVNWFVDPDTVYRD